MANSVSEIAVNVRPLSHDDSLARAAEAVRTAPGGAAPVQEYGEITGLVCAEELADRLAEMPPDAVRIAVVRDVARSMPAPLRSDLAIPEALGRLRADG